MKTFEELVEIAESRTWEEFGSNQKGELIIDDILFRLRWGLLFQRPTQVIMAYDKILRLRNGGNPAGPLLNIEPDRGADNCLYVQFFYDGLSKTEKTYHTWVPQPSSSNMATMYQYAQQTRNSYPNGIGGIAGAAAAPLTQPNWWINPYYSAT